MKLKIHYAGNILYDLLIFLIYEAGFTEEILIKSDRILIIIVSNMGFGGRVDTYWNRVAILAKSNVQMPKKDTSLFKLEDYLIDKR